MFRKEKGFTLIELLIVIVIIGILAGVLIAVINPTAQQNRARDANVKAMINKVALATQSYISAYGSSPNGLQFLASLSGSATDSAAVCVAGSNVCSFAIAGNALPSAALGASGGCTSSYSSYAGDGAGQCYYYYTGVPGAAPCDALTGGCFQIFAKSWGRASTVFRYQNFGTTAQGNGQIFNCTAADTTVCTTP